MWCTTKEYQLKSFYTEVCGDYLNFKFSLYETIEAINLGNIGSCGIVQKYQLKGFYSEAYGDYLNCNSHYCLYDVLFLQFCSK